jgi:thioesterase domain-containing protein
MWPYRSKSREVDRRFAVAQMLLASNSAANARARTECHANRVFMFGGSGGFDEQSLVRFRSHKKQSLNIEFVPLGNWRDWCNEDADFDTLAALACSYITQVSNGGPIRLAGYSQGGQIAFATALALERAGVPVEILGLLDTLEDGEGQHAFRKLGFWQSILKPTKDWLVTRLRRRTLNEVPGGDPRIRILVGISHLPFGSHLVTGLGRLAPLLVGRRTSLGLDRIIQMGTFHKMWFDWVKKRPDAAPLKAPVVLFRSQRPGPPDLGWTKHQLELTIVPIGGNHFTLFAPEFLEALIASFAGAMCPSLRQSANGSR